MKIDVNESRSRKQLQRKKSLNKPLNGAIKIPRRSTLKWNRKTTKQKKRKFLKGIALIDRLDNITYAGNMLKSTKMNKRNTYPFRTSNICAHQFLTFRNKGRIKKNEQMNESLKTCYITNYLFVLSDLFIRKQKKEWRNEQNNKTKK